MTCAVTTELEHFDLLILFILIGQFFNNFNNCDTFSLPIANCSSCPEKKRELIVWNSVFVTLSISCKVFGILNYFY